MQSLLLEMSQEEWEFLQHLSETESTSSRNVFRRAIRSLAEARGVVIPEGLFADRQKGNFLPKSDLPTMFSDRQVITAVSGDALTAAS